MLHAKQRLVLPIPFGAWLHEASAPNVVSDLPLDVDVVLTLETLPASFHGDPADRILVITAKAHGQSIATRDAMIRRSRFVALWKP